MSPSTRRTAGPARKTSLKEMAARIAGARVGEASTLSATPTRGGGRRERVPPHAGAPVQTPPRHRVTAVTPSLYGKSLGLIGENGVLSIMTTLNTFQHTATMEITQSIRASMYTF